MYREYTDCELRQCLKSVTLGTMNQAEAREQYGPSEKTQDTYAKSIGSHFGLEPPKIFRQLRVFAETNGDAVGHFIDSMEIGKSGRQAFLSDAERNLVFLAAAQREEAGFGVNRPLHTHRQSWPHNWRSKKSKM